MGKVINFGEAGEKLRRRKLPVITQLTLLEIERGNPVSMKGAAKASFPVHLQDQMLLDLGMRPLPPTHYTGPIPEDYFPPPMC